VLQAHLGDAAAQKALAHIRHECDEAAQSLGDLQLALPEAQQQLAAAEAAHKGAEAEQRKVITGRLARERVAAAARIDAALAEVAAAFLDYERLGKELFGAADHGGVMSQLEGILGLTRLAAALPAKPFLDLKKNHPMADIGIGPSLAIAEARVWNLPPAGIDRAA
jgi:hypothetical protein